MSIPLKVVRLSKLAVLPGYATERASGLDLTAALDAPLHLEPGARALVPTGLAVAVPPGHEGQIRPRSGLASRYGVTLVNSPGTIDEDYRGELKIALINLSREPFTVQNGMRIAQLVLAPISRVEVQAADHLDGTDRGSGGFGHTGLR